MTPLSNLHVKGNPAVLPDRAIRGQSHYFIYRPHIVKSNTKYKVCIINKDLCFVCLHSVGVTSVEMVLLFQA